MYVFKVLSRKVGPADGASHRAVNGVAQTGWGQVWGGCMGGFVDVFFVCRLGCGEMGV